MERVVIVGSGASGVHFALSVLKKGHHVIMLDVGNQKQMPMDYDLDFHGLKTQLEDPVRYFLGDEYEGVLFPGAKGEYYGVPPSKQYIFSKPALLNFQATGFEPLLSFARGGLAEAWTGGVYPLNDAELQEFPFRFTDLEPYYADVAERIGITGAKDDLVRFYPLHDNLMPALHMDDHSQQLLEQYERHKDRLNALLGIYLGRSRVATLSTDKGDRKACSYSGRCLWGCPTRSLYTPSLTLEQCHRYSKFTYIPGMYVTHFRYNAGREVISVVGQSLYENKTHFVSGDRFVLAAGTLSSSKIFLDSILRGSGEIVKLHGLMDNRQILIPYINLKMIGTGYNPNTYQYHQLAMGIETEKLEEYIHCQITTLKTALVHPIIQSIPLDLPSAISVFRDVRAGLGVVNVNLHDRRRETNYVTVEGNNDTEHSTLLVRYSPAVDERVRVERTIGTVKKCLRQLGCVVPPGMIHVRPMGASVHYAGTIPMSTQRNPCTASRYCQSNDFENLYFVDGTTFPFLPAKNLTLTLMANAARVADHAF